MASLIRWMTHPGMWRSSTSTAPSLWQIKVRCLATVSQSEIDRPVWQHSTVGSTVNVWQLKVYFRQVAVQFRVKVLVWSLSPSSLIIWSCCCEWGLTDLDFIYFCAFTAQVWLVSSDWWRVFSLSRSPFQEPWNKENTFSLSSFCYQVQSWMRNLTGVMLLVPPHQLEPVWPFSSESRCSLEMSDW